MHHTQIRPRFCDTDALGHLNNTSYFAYMEEARIQLFNDLELINADQPLHDWPYVLVSTNCEYKKQGYFGIEITLESKVKHIGTSSFTLSHTIINGNTAIATGEAVVVQLDTEKGKATPLSEEVKSRLARYVV
ncbi:acyl-CoA thioesterase [Salsuginibacillus kocurii]|uniref:acyl-CoA thioesterase n=1 Tax=Salsuginibacillus kocurii TaxID=427078 RepID=UPI0003715428|nr:thioesterase family protein [Salsuginibacillus kocurii]